MRDDVSVRNMYGSGREVNKEYNDGPSECES